MKSNYEPKFTAAYCSNTNKFYSLSELIEYEKNNSSLFKRDIQNNLYCPECLQAPLAYVHGDSIYLRTYRKNIHKEGCGLIQPKVNSIEFEKIADDPENNEAISNHIYKMAHSVFSEKPTKSVIHPSSKKASINLEEKENLEEPKKRKRKSHFPRQCLTNGIKYDAFDEYKYFYGELYLMWYTKNIKLINNNQLFKNNMILAFLSEHSKKSIFAIKMSEMVCKYISEKFPIKYNQPQKRKFVFLSKMELSQNGHYNFLIRHSTHFYIHHD